MCIILGTPKYSGNFNAIIEKAKYEANIFKKNKLDAVLIENMHDIPYIRDEQIGPETVASMTRITSEVRQILPTTPLGIQILACGNKQALAVAKATDCQFIRVEGFVFSHIADEGFTDANAGKLLRYRKSIDANDILVLTDIKKKHSSHSITADVTLLETAHAAEFFMSDGLILTGTATGSAASVDDLKKLHKKVKAPLLIGSGVTTENLKNYYSKVEAIIVGSHFKKNGSWENELCETRLSSFMEKAYTLSNESEPIIMSYIDKIKRG